MSDNQIKEIGFIEKNNKSRYVVTTTEWRNNHYFDIREYYVDDGDEWKPTKKGVRLSVEFLPELMDMLKKVEIDTKVKKE
ncbi:MAG: hypothetical protein DKM50_12775 [Candidatus Margulisiibacteriota bacterium]|nr:MAG: hypothetical protein A2X43_01245 [Candidatus Margulisbacteria bacterium GWD2_39_127]OGI05356.1 MAG: hypothetical protein A2X42_05885 [Candidatus Margulisbacteria bacterium GWF2_38_17]OGI05813.1 MAG: hypothetical protein A2X41_02745 [Candidatus Margulisbacteria bacterium GWE2_39_32]PZM77409.1 MAG: hypothetical protein DKM50_12775 [Candidatus Margulisiibacteriota bacterium]HAR62283.1 hypothetical protein [Candidatus Margulisiibacteriota bacterium]